MTEEEKVGAVRHNLVKFVLKFVNTSKLLSEGIFYGGRHLTMEENGENIWMHD